MKYEGIDIQHTIILFDRFSKPVKLGSDRVWHHFLDYSEGKEDLYHKNKKWYHLYYYRHQYSATENVNVPDSKI